MTAQATMNTPTLLARIALDLLVGALVLPGLVRTDISDLLASYGETVQMRRRDPMTAQTVDPDTGWSTQALSGSLVNVSLDKHKVVGWQPTDRDNAKSIANLVEDNVDPAVQAIVEDVEGSIAGLHSDFTATPLTVGSAGAWETQAAAAQIYLNNAKAPDVGRSAVFCSEDMGAIAKLSSFQDLSKSGSNTALREGIVGRVKGFNSYRSSGIKKVGSPTLYRYNMFFHKAAIGMVARTLSPAAGQSGNVTQTTLTDPQTKLSLRWTQSYTHNRFASLVSLDFLYGVKTLMADLGIVGKASGF